MSITAMKQALEALEAPTSPMLSIIQEETITSLRQAIEQAEKQVVFKIYKPTLPRGAIPNVRDAELPWVYDQDPSSGNVASMWVTPVKATPQPQQAPVAWKETDVVECPVCRDKGFPWPKCGHITYLEPTPQQQREWVGLTDEEIKHAPHHMVDGAYHYSFKQGAEWAEAKLKEKNT